jgi:hypothetical protein
MRAQSHAQLRLTSASRCRLARGQADPEATSTHVARAENPLLVVDEIDKVVGRSLISSSAATSCGDRRYDTQPTIRDVIATTSAETGLSEPELTADGRSRNLITRLACGMALPPLDGRLDHRRAFAGRGHTTIMNASARYPEFRNDEHRSMENRIERALGDRARHVVRLRVSELEQKLLELVKHDPPRVLEYLSLLVRQMPLANSNGVPWKL